MPALLDRITARLDRLRATTPVVAKPAPRPEPAPSPEPAVPAEPLTMESLRNALSDLHYAQQEQQAIIIGAEAERDRILDDEAGDDAEILEIDRRVALARLSLDRLGRLQEEAFAQLRPLEMAEQAARWVAARDRYLRMMQDVHKAMETYERAANVLWAHRNALFNPVGVAGWDDQVPRLPHFAKAVPGGMVVYDSHQYAAEAGRFSRMTIGAPSMGALTFPERLSRFVEGKIDLAEFAMPAGAWGASVEDLSDHAVLVRLTRSISLPDGEILALGAVVKVTARHARELIAAGRAVLSDTLTTLSGYRPAGAEQPLRVLPLPASTSLPTEPGVQHVPQK